MGNNSRVTKSVIAFAIVALALTGCSSSAPDSAKSVASKESSQPEEAVKSNQSASDACNKASEALQKAFTEYGKGMPAGTAVDAAALLEATKMMSQTLADASADITNEEISKAFVVLIDDVDNMIATNEEQIKVKTETGSVPDELNNTLEEQTNALNENVTALETACS